MQFFLLTKVGIRVPNAFLTRDSVFHHGLLHFIQSKSKKDGEIHEEAF